MKEFQNLNQEEQVDLRIVEHLDMQNLPESLQTMLSLAKTDEEKDMLLMATLAAASACVPNVYFKYGPTALAAWYKFLEEQGGMVIKESHGEYRKVA